METRKIETFEVPEYRLAFVAEWFEKINRRAVKLGVAGIGYVVERIEERKKNRLRSDGSIFRDIDGTPFTYVERIAHVKVNGNSVKLNGWRLIAVVKTTRPVYESTVNADGSLVLDADGKYVGDKQVGGGVKLLNVVPGEECPEVFRTLSNDECDHCHTRRYRTEVFVVGHDDGRFVQVGRQCIADFLGNISPEAILQIASFVDSLQEALDDDGEGGFGYRSAGPQPVKLENFLRTAAWVIRSIGWTSKAQSSFDNPPTASTVNLVLWPVGKYQIEDAEKFYAKHSDDRHAEDAATAEKAIEWIFTQADRNGSNYIENLKAIVAGRYVGPRESGLACSLIAAYARERDIQLKKARKLWSACCQEVAQEGDCVKSKKNTSEPLSFGRGRS